MTKLSLKKILSIIISVIVVIVAIVLAIIFATRKSNDDNKTNTLSTNFNYTESDLNMKLIINGKEFQCTLENNNTAKTILSKLPLTINMNELHGNEKYYYFSESLPVSSERFDTIHEGDILLYQNNCLVLFYDTFKSGYSYTRVGKIDNTDGLKNAVGSGDVTVTISN